MSQKLNIKLNKWKTLNYFQRLLKNINWVWPNLKITTGKLHILFKTLKNSILKSKKY